jgi:DNA repair exonuclease SbcCD ATPase subunit
MLQLTNFRCWENKQLVFPDKGICLLSGKSGRGKSTILNSLVYAITGKGKNITTFQKKSTTVQIEIDGLVITRQRGPNRLVVKRGDQTYEDDAAQAVIDATFGTEFCNTSYIDQENANSFVFLSPTEKIEFLEKLLLHKYNIDDMKDKVKNAITQAKLDHAAAESKHTTLQDMFSRLSYQTPEDVYVTKGDDDQIKLTSTNRQKLGEKIASNLDVMEKNIKTIATKIKKWEHERQECSYINETRAFLAAKIDDVRQEMSSLTATPEDVEVLQRQKTAYERHKTERRRRELQQELDARKLANQTEKNDYLRQLATLPDLTMVKKTITQLEQVNHVMESLVLIEDKLENKDEYDEEKNERDLVVMTTKRDVTKNNVNELQKMINEHQRHYSCPSCKAILKIQRDQLVYHTQHANTRTLPEMQHALDEATSLLSTYNTGIDALKAKKVVHERLEAEYNEMFDRLEALLTLPSGEVIDQDQIDETLNRFVDIKTKQEGLNQLIRELNNDRSIQLLDKELQSTAATAPSPAEGSATSPDETNDSICSEAEYPLLLDKIALKRGELARLDGLQRKYEDCQKQLDNLPVTEKTDQEFVELLSQHRNKLDTYQKKMEQYRTYLQQMEKWDRVDRDNHMYNDMERNIAEMDIKKASLMDRLRCLVKLRDHIKQAEQQSLMDFIDSLNQHAAVYIEDFFDDDITVEMKTIQEGKTTGKEKITLHFDVQYRNMSGDLSFLSGGEKDRVNLAFTLAFSELVDTRMLLLDECISSLDGETSNVVLENLKEKYKGKLVVVVSHQANLGFFDHVIDL